MSQWGNHGMRNAIRSSRWLILSMLFAASVMNYIDRQTLSIMARTIQNELHITDTGYAFIVNMFLLAYMLGFLTVGWVADKLGVRRSMAIFVGWWSVSDMLTGFASSLRSLASTRFLLGIGEAGFYTVAPKVVSERFAPAERGLAVGIYSAGATIGATIAPPLLAWIALTSGWRKAFLYTGCAGLLWCLPWLLLFRSKPKAPTEPEPDANQKPLDWLREKTGIRKDVLLLFGARTLTDPIFTFILFWFPKYLTDVDHMTLGALGRIVWIVYLAADLGSLFGGFLSGVFVRRGMRPARARQITMTGAACLLPLSFFVPFTHGHTAAIALITGVAFAHVVWMVTITTLAVDIFPERNLGSIFGIISVGAGLGGMIGTTIIGYVVTRYSYNPIFLGMGFFHPLALALIWQVGRRRPSSAAKSVPALPA